MSCSPQSQNEPSFDPCLGIFYQEGEIDHKILVVGVVQDYYAGAYATVSKLFK